MRKKNTPINPFPPPLPSSQAQLPSRILHLLRLSGAGGRGMGLAASSLRVVSAAPSSSRSCPAPAWGPSHGRQSSTNCSSVGPSQGAQSFRNRLLQRGSPHRVASPASKAAPARAPLHRAASPARSLLQRGLPTGSQPPLGAIPCTAVGSSTGCRWISAPPWTSTGCRVRACVTMVLPRSGRGISAPVPGAPPPLLLPCPGGLQGCFSHIFSNTFSLRRCHCR